jgi:hypothetical protein
MEAVETFVEGHGVTRVAGQGSSERAGVDEPRLRKALLALVDPVRFLPGLWAELTEDDIGG